MLLFIPNDTNQKIVIFWIFIGPNKKQTSMFPVTQAHCILTTKIACIVELTRM